MTNNYDAFKEFPSLCPPAVAVAATRRRRHCPLHGDYNLIVGSGDGNGSIESKNFKIY